MPSAAASTAACISAGQLAYSLTNRVRARTVAPPDTEAVRWEALRLTVGHIYDLKKNEPGDLFGTLIIQPTERIGVRGDISHSVRGQGIELLTADLKVRLDPLPFSVSVGSRYSDTASINFFTTGLSAACSAGSSSRRRASRTRSTSA